MTGKREEQENKPVFLDYIYMQHEALTYRINECAFAVYRELGSGLLESVYQNAMMIALRKAGLDAQSQVPLKVHFQDECVGDFYADIVVNDTVIVELKSARVLTPKHEAQLVNYLNITRQDIGLLINFGESKAEVRRKYRKYAGGKSKENEKSV